ncbi:sugar phosphate isomerase/epimerase family protein [Ruminiclostridium cellobioparum]|uniref:Sugar phosphate isomerase/epimerase n=1 Tax=Ruminiclostridium cellobioparum subsp. termitidis CT1112 TaxID=1195236 RepID=S0FPV9_RUMCE|nr:sugar phosphate isomerase/epimerase [Ruminiclostridium cellobioparum]EMS71224.1 sugar phosphate isomerase/epimerase [Ruminiclostridium cellobioparum subsp. termitidis CT1112]
MMKKQNYEITNEKIKRAFLKLKKNNPEKLKRRLNLSWSNWGFGVENLEESAERLFKAGIKYIELHGNHYSTDLGYNADEVLKVLGKFDIKVAGVCGMFSDDNDLSSNRAIQRQGAIDYIRREVPFTAAVGGSYMLVLPGDCGRPLAYDNMEFERSVETIRGIADIFVKYDVKAAIEPVRSAEISFIHTVDDAIKYIKAVNHPGIAHINGDVYHMQSEESHIGEAIIEAGEKLVNLHMADSNRCALGDGAMDLDTIIMALYLIGYNTEGRYVTPEPLGPGGAPYPAMYGKPDKASLDSLVMQSAKYFREREEILLG